MRAPTRNTKDLPPGNNRPVPSQPPAAQPAALQQNSYAHYQPRGLLWDCYDAWAQAMSVWLEGMSDALAFHTLFGFFYKSHTIRLRFAQCFLLNGMIFLGSLLLINFLIQPFVTSLLFQPDPDPGIVLAASGVRGLFTVVFNLLWLYPVYSLSFVLNSSWYAEIAEHAYRVRFGAQGDAAFSYDEWLRMLADEIYRLLLFSSYLLQLFLLDIIPVVGRVLSLVSVTWLYAFYSFDYKWTMRKWSLDKGMQFFEQHWVYFAGFGAPFAAATFFFPTLISNGIFALLFPLFIMMATVARPVHTTHPLIPSQLPLFYFCRNINLFLLKRLRALRVSSR